MKFVAFRPTLEGPFAARFYSKMREAVASEATNNHDDFIRLVNGEVGWSLNEENLNPRQRRMYRACWLVLRDLQRIAWRFRWRANSLELAPPDTTARVTNQADVSSQKQAVRDAMSFGRDSRLERAKDFIAKMESPPVRGLASRPISDLIADGKSLASDLSSVGLLDRSCRLPALKNVIRPYIQLVNEKERCVHSGHLLSDIWRYFRLTWANPPESTPGRTMLYLVRDAARPFHPVIAIMSLENAPLRVTCRDDFLDWTPESFIRKTDSLSSDAAFKRAVHSLLASLEASLRDVSPKGICTPRELAHPTDALIQRLTDIAKASANERLTAVRDWMGRDDTDPDSQLQQSDLGNISTKAEQALYKRKRADKLARILTAQLELGRILQVKPLRTEGRRLLHTESGMSAVRTALIGRKNCHIGTSVLELNVCGAIPPYSYVLGGKLAALLALSPRIVEDYRRRYGGRASDIASRMKGSPVIRPADLVYVGTTSLYAVGSSQYNRLRLPAGLFEPQAPASSGGE